MQPQTSRELAEVLSGTMYETTKAFHENAMFKRVATGMLGAWSLAVMAVGVEAVIDERCNNDALVFCQDQDTERASIDKQVMLQPAPADAELVDLQLQNEIAPQEKTIAQQLGIELDPRVEQAMQSMNLTRAGYAEFIRNLDTSWLEPIQRLKEFNPHLLMHDIEQRPSEVFVLHFTVIYANSDLTPNTSLSGQFDVNRLAEGMAGRYGHGGRCCGINWAIGRSARTFQTAPLNAKLNHNPPYDSVSTGVEIEAGEQAAITTAQYEAAAYLAIAVLDTQSLLGNYPLERILQGHGEMRDRIIQEWNANHPQSRLGVRDDFNEPESRFFRYFVQRFIDANPDLLGTRPLAHLPQ